MNILSLVPCNSFNGKPIFKYIYLPNIQFHWQLETTNSYFWLVNILLRKFETLSKKEIKMIKTQISWWKTSKKYQISICKHIVAFFILNSPHWPIALQLYWNRTSAWVLSCKFTAYFQNTFSQEHLWMAASEKLKFLFVRTQITITLSNSYLNYNES